MDTLGRIIISRLSEKGVVRKEWALLQRGDGLFFHWEKGMERKGKERKGVTRAVGIVVIRKIMYIQICMCLILMSLSHPLVHYLHPAIDRFPSLKLCSMTRSRYLKRHARHSTRSVILAAGPQVTADLRDFAKSHADA